MDDFGREVATTKTYNEHYCFYANIHRPFVKRICNRTLAWLMCVIYCLH